MPTAVALLTRAARQNPRSRRTASPASWWTAWRAVDKVNGFKWHLIAKTAGNGDPDLDARLAELSPEDRKKAEDAAKRWSAANEARPALTSPRFAAKHRGASAHRAALHRSRRVPQAERMLHSALINVMVKAARRAGRSLKRDLGEIENLQVSLKGPANFVSLADKRAEQMLYDDLTKARPGYGFLGEEGGSARARKYNTWTSIRSTAHNFLHASRSSDLYRPAARGHNRRRRDLQSRQ